MRPTVNQELVLELDRLIAALHANRCHPDFVYIVVPEDESLIDFACGGWEPCPETPLLPGDVCWRREKKP